jgi:hypothetical protein
MQPLLSSQQDLPVWRQMKKLKIREATTRLEVTQQAAAEQGLNSGLSNSKPGLSTLEPAVATMCSRKLTAR